MSSEIFLKVYPFILLTGLFISGICLNVENLCFKADSLIEFSSSFEILELLRDISLILILNSFQLIFTDDTSDFSTSGFSTAGISFFSITDFGISLCTGVDESSFKPLSIFVASSSLNIFLSLFLYSCMILLVSSSSVNFDWILSRLLEVLLSKFLKILFSFYSLEY